MNDDKKIMNIIALAYQILAKASNQEPTREGLLLVLEMLGEDGIKQCVETADEGPEAVAEAMIQILKLKLARMAANGAKLQYLLLLKGKCPQGYLKHGGRCKPCEKLAGVFNNRADLLNYGGNVNWKKELEKLLTPKNLNNKTDKKDNKDIKKLPKLGEPKKQQDNKEMYDDMRLRQKRKLMARNGGILKFQGGGPTISDYRRRQLELRRLAYEKARTTEEGVPTGPSFTLQGTSSSPIRLEGVDVYGKPVRASKHTNYTWFYTNYPHRTSTDYLRYPGGTVYARTVEASPFRNDTTYNVWSKNGLTYLLTGSDFDEGIKNALRDYGHPYSTNLAPRLKDRGKPIHGKPEY